MRIAAPFALAAFAGMASAAFAQDNAQSRMGRVEMFNGSGETVRALVLRDCDDRTRSLTLLRPGQTVPPGQRAQFEVAPGCWIAEFDAGVAPLRLTVAPGRTAHFALMRGAAQR